MSNGVGYFIKPLDYQAAVVDYFSEEVSEEIRELREADLRELEQSEGKEVVDEIRRWCSKNLDKDSEGLCYQKGNDYWILYYNKAINDLSAWYEPELTAEMELKVRICYTYSDGAEGVWCLEKISSPIPVKKVIGYDDKTYDILFYDDFSNSSADVDPSKDVRNFYGINGGIVPRWDCRYILHDLITEGIEEEGDVDTSVKPEVLEDLKVSDEVKEEIRQVYTKDWKGKEGLMVHKTEDADISIYMENNNLIMNCYSDANYLFDIEPFCWKLFAVKSSVEIKQIEITADDVTSSILISNGNLES